MKHHIKLRHPGRYETDCGIIVRDKTHVTSSRMDTSCGLCIEKMATPAEEKEKVPSEPIDQEREALIQMGYESGYNQGYRDASKKAIEIITKGLWSQRILKPVKSSWSKSRRLNEISNPQRNYCTMKSELMSIFQHLMGLSSKLCRVSSYMLRATD